MKRRRKYKKYIHGCLLKKRHDSEAEAEETAIWQSKQEHGATFWYYKCIFCEGYHTYRE